MASRVTCKLLQIEKTLKDLTRLANAMSFTRFEGSYERKEKEKEKE